MSEPREFWIEQGLFVKVVHDKKDDLNGWKIKDPIHVIEHQAYIKEKEAKERAVLEMKRFEEIMSAINKYKGYPFTEALDKFRKVIKQLEAGK